MSIEERRKKEVAKYASIYGTRAYTMNARRMAQSIAAMRSFLKLHPYCTSMLDVGCGDGKWMRVAADEFKFSCVGVEPVARLARGNIVTALATSLPFTDNSFDVVTCLDVMEHLVPEDTEPALQEIARVAIHGAVITVNNNKSAVRGPGGSELHINRRPYEEWQTLMERIFGSATMLNEEGSNRVFLV